MLNKIVLVLMVVIMSALVGCELDTGHTSEDAAAAQSFFPNLARYSTQETGNVQDAIVTALGGSALLTGNIIQAALVQRVDALLDCYRDRGAIDAKIYTENVDQLQEARVPIAGVLAVINQDRVFDNFAGCLLSPHAQSAEPEPCSDHGSFTFEGDTILYIYAATDTPLCSLFEQHFAAYGG